MNDKMAGEKKKNYIHQSHLLRCKQLSYNVTNCKGTNANVWVVSVNKRESFLSLHQSHPFVLQTYVMYSEIGGYINWGTLYLKK